MKIIMWWHRKQGHKQTESQVTVPLFAFDRGILVRCDCGEVWAL